MHKAFRSFTVPVHLLCALICILLLAFPTLASASKYSEAVEADTPIAYWSELKTVSGVKSIPDQTGHGYTLTSPSGVGSDISAGTSPTGDPALVFGGNTSNNGAITPLKKSELSKYSTEGVTWDYWFKSNQLTGSWNADTSGQSQYGLNLNNANNNTPHYDQWATGLNTTKTAYNNPAYFVDYAHGKDETARISGLTPDTNWHYVAFTVTPTAARYYIDGELVWTYTGTQPNINGEDKFTMSTYKGDSWPNGNYSSLRGSMSDVAVYNHLLSAEQIKHHYQVGLNFSFSYPEVLWTRAGSSTYHDGSGAVLSGTPSSVGNASGWTYSIAPGYALPGELALNSSTGTISGTPHSNDEVNSEYHLVRIKATREGHSVLSNEFTLVILPKEPQQQLRPILLFDDGEKWRPLNVNDFLADDYSSETEDEPANQYCEVMSLTEKEMAEGNEEAFKEKCHNFITGSVFGMTENTEWFSSHDSEAYELNVHGSESDPDEHYQSGCSDEVLLDCSSSGQALYWHKIYKGESPEEVKVDEEREEPIRATGNAYYDYWDYYRYDQYEVPLLPGDEGDHESDWEGDIVASNSPGKNPTGFDWVGMSAHTNTWRYLNGTLYCDYEEKDYSCLDGPDEANGQRVEVFVAKGSHGTYPRPCNEYCDRSTNAGSFEGAGLSEQDYGGQNAWSVNNDPSILNDLNAPENKPWAEWQGDWSRVEEAYVKSPLKQKRAEEPWSLYYEECSERYNEPVETGEYCESEEEIEDDSFSSHDRTTQYSMRSSSKQNPCRTWEGPFVQASICNPDTIQEEINQGNLSKPNSISIVNPQTDPSALAASAPGITQLVGYQPIPTGSPIEIQGTISTEDQIHLVAEDGSGEVYSVNLSGDEIGQEVEELTIEKEGLHLIAVINNHNNHIRHRIGRYHLHRLNKRHLTKHSSSRSNHDK